MNKMKVLILTDSGRWFDQEIAGFIKEIRQTDLDVHIEVCHDHKVFLQSNFLFCFMLGYSRIVQDSFLKLFNKALVVHASSLPKGKGMSPMTWQIIEGKKDIVFSLFEAVEELDAGDIFLQKTLHLGGNELVSELRNSQKKITLDLVISYLQSYKSINAKKQFGEESRYRSRAPRDSELDPQKSIQDQFNLLRVCDNDSYPAFFYLKGHKYIIKIYKDS